jgi:secernin
MCDTLVALGNTTQDGSVIFAKNSDREPNEAQEVIVVPEADHSEGATVKCTYVEIPQVRHTQTVLLCKPFWMWGAEMGANESGLVIGNEAVFTKVPYQKTPGLTGMDFIRLALERENNAEGALWTIIHLLEKYGQGGNCGFDHPFYYHNSFIIADPGEAWVLETAGRQWAAEKVKDVRSISNALSIPSQGDLHSSELVPYAIDRGWCKSRDDFDFTRCYSDFLYTTLGDSRKRRACTLTSLQSRREGLKPEDMFAFLRSHGPRADKPRDPSRGLLGAEVCMHAGFGPVRDSQTVGSLVAHLKEGQATYWVTGTAAPCTSVFKPVWLDSGLPDMGPVLSGKFDPETLFWRHEILHRKILRSYTRRMESYPQKRDELEAEFVQQIAKVTWARPAERRQFSEECFRRAAELEAGWLTQAAQFRDSPQNALYQIAWNGYNKKSAMVDLDQGILPRAS